MKRVLAALAGFVMAASAATASAHVVVLTTSIPAVEATDEGQLRAALGAAIDDAVTQAIRFTPTVVTVESLQQIADRIYLVLLVVDHDGEELMRQLKMRDVTPSPEPAPQDSTDREST